MFPSDSHATPGSLMSTEAEDETRRNVDEATAVVVDSHGHDG
jgi:hypothetical protein